MTWVRILTLSALLALATAAVTPPKREGLSEWPGQAMRQHLILGESYAAGVGAGDDFSTNCSRRNGAFGNQLWQSDLFQDALPSGYGKPVEQFFACSGSTCDNIRQEQVIDQSEYYPPAGIVVLSAGGNDADYSRVVAGCIIYPIPETDQAYCDYALQASYNAILSQKFNYDYFALIEQIYISSQWQARPYGRAQLATLVYQHGYPQYFEDYTTQCNNVNFGLPRSFTVSQDVRQRINFGQQLLNAVLAYYIDRVNVKYGKYPVDFIAYTNSDWRWTGHRFCDPSHDEQYFGQDGWVFHFNSDRERGAGTTSPTPAGKVSDFDAWDPTTCDLDAIDEDLTNAVGCAVSKMIAAGNAPNPLPLVSGDDFPDKTFHPRINGHEAIAAHIEETLGYREGETPSGAELRIMAIGDSITDGYRSSEGSGYRKPLFDILSKNNEIRFVGSRSTGQPGSRWEHNEGYSGITTEGLLKQLRSSKPVQKYGPNVVILMVGTNDINGPVSPDTAVNNLQDIILEIRSQRPQVSIVVGHIPPNGRTSSTWPLSEKQRLVIQYNAGVNVFVNRLNSQQPATSFPRILVQHTACSDDPVDKADALHPNDRGYSKIASSFAQAIYQLSNAGLIFPPTTPIDSPTAECNSAPNWIPNGEIAGGAGLGKNRYPDITCTPYTTNGPNGDDLEPQCVCTDPALASSPAGGVTVKERIGSRCEDMNYYLINAVHFADIDGDGLADYLWVDQAGGIQLYQNGGPSKPDQPLQAAQRIWKPRGQIASGVGGSREEIQFGDLNGDGRDDYLWIHGDGSVSAWINGGMTVDSSGNAVVTWLPQGVIASGTGTPGSSIAFADLNGDGRVEYLSVSRDGSVECYLNGPAAVDDGPNAGKRSWIPQGEIASGVGGTRNQTFWADINGEGRADYLKVTIKGSGAVSAWKNGGGPDNGPNAAKIVWLPQGEIAGGAGLPGANVMFADLDGDGRAEYLSVDADTSAVTAYYNGCPE